jgi:hypothetical protein
MKKGVMEITPVNKRNRGASSHLRSSQRFPNTMGQIKKSLLNYTQNNHAIAQDLQEATQSLSNNLVIRKLPRSLLSEAGRSSETFNQQVKNLQLKDIVTQEVEDEHVLDIQHFNFDVKQRNTQTNQFNTNQTLNNTLVDKGVASSTISRKKQSKSDMS